jgi:hypothetical protein
MDNDQKDQNGNGGEKKKRVVMNGPNFYKLCQMMTEERGVLQAECPTIADTARTYEKRLGFQVLPAHVKQAQEATGVHWTPRIKGTAKGGVKKTNGTRILVTAVRFLHKELTALQRELGKPECRMPETFDQLHEYFSTKRGEVPEHEQIDADAAKVAQGDSTSKAQVEPVPAQANGGVGAAVFKVGDEVTLDGSPFKRHRIHVMRGNGRVAVLDNNHEVQVSRLRLIKK